MFLDKVCVISTFYLLFTGLCFSQVQERIGANPSESDNSADEYIKSQINELPQADSVLESMGVDSAAASPLTPTVAPDEEKDEEEAPYEDYKPSWAQPEDLKYSPRSERQSIEIQGGMSTILGEENDWWKWGPNVGFNIVVPAFYVLHIGVGVNYVYWDLSAEPIRKDLENTTGYQFPFLLVEGKKNSLRITPFLRFQSISETSTNKMYLDLGGGIYFSRSKKEYSGSVPANFTNMDQIAGNEYLDEILPGVLCGGGLISRVFKHINLALGPELNYVITQSDQFLYVLIKGGLQVNLKMY